MNIEITGKRHVNPAGWIFYDGECRLCVASRQRWGRLFESRGFIWLPLQTPGTAERLGVTPAQLMAEMWMLPASGRPAAGIDAWIGLMRCVWWLKPLALVISLPGIRRLARSGYRWLARNRHCIAGQCRIPEHPPG